MSLEQEQQALRKWLLQNRYMYSVQLERRRKSGRLNQSLPRLLKMWQKLGQQRMIKYQQHFLKIHRLLKCFLYIK